METYHHRYVSRSLLSKGCGLRAKQPLFRSAGQIPASEIMHQFFSYRNLSLRPRSVFETFAIQREDRIH